MKARIKATGEIIEVERVIDAYGYDRYIQTPEVPGCQYYNPDELDFLPEKETAVIEGYVARDMNGILKLFNGEPGMTECYGANNGYYWGDVMRILPKDSFPSVTWQSEPKKIRIILEMIEE